MTVTMATSPLTTGTTRGGQHQQLVNYPCGHLVNVPEVDMDVLCQVPGDWKDTLGWTGQLQEQGQ